MGRQKDEVKTMGIALLNYADDYGYFYADPANIRSFARPFDDESKMTLGCIQQLTKIEFIEVRQHPTRGFIGRVINFLEHQRVDKPKDSKIKKFFDESEALINLGLIQDESKINPAGKEGKGRERIVKEENQNLSSAPADNMLVLSPEKTDKYGITPSDKEVDLKTLFTEYLQKTGRNPKLNEFTEKKKRQARACYEVCLAKADRGSSPAEHRANAVGLMRACIDAMASSDFHMGRDAKSNGEKRDDWGLLFRSVDRLEFWWNRAERPKKGPQTA